MEQQLKEIYNHLSQRLTSCTEKDQVADLRIMYLGKKGKFTQACKGIASIPPEQRAEAGKIINHFKDQIQDLCQAKIDSIEEEYFENLKEQEWHDMTCPSTNYVSHHLMQKERGYIHPISQIQKQLEDIFTSAGFSILDGCYIVSDFYNFKALNFSEDHPARDMQDTFYLTNEQLLRTHTSSVQVKGLLTYAPPMRIIAPGRVFRYEEIDASHEHTFYQMEGMMIDKQISVSSLLYFMDLMLREIFNQKVKVRLRPGYFPFVEPGFELDMNCLLCNGKGCSVCSHSGWVEILPCGLVHPNVLRNCNIDPTKWQGAAFGLGLNRLVMMRYAIEDIRHFQGANLTFLRQFL